jgi:hypothetical protein
MPARMLALIVACTLLAGTACKKRDCSSPTDPCGDPNNLAGAWSGTSSYINAPFTMELRHTGATVTGQYRDQKDTGTASGTVAASTVVIDVTFGDTGIRFTGTITSRSRVSGEVLVPALGGQRFPFDMSR